MKIFLCFYVLRKSVLVQNFGKSMMITLLLSTFYHTLMFLQWNPVWAKTSLASKTLQEKNGSWSHLKLAFSAHTKIHSSAKVFTNQLYQFYWKDFNNSLIFLQWNPVWGKTSLASKTLQEKNGSWSHSKLAFRAHTKINSSAKVQLKNYLHHEWWWWKSRFDA